MLIARLKKTVDFIASGHCFLWCITASIGLAQLVSAEDLVSQAELPETRALQSITRLPVPMAEMRRQSAAKVREIFGEDASKASSPEAKSKLSIELLGHAADTQDSTDRYVLLEAALRLASESGDVATTFRVVDAISARYAIDEDSAKQSALESMAAKAPLTALPQVIDALLLVSQEEASANEMHKAEELAQLAATAARRSKDRDRQKVVVDKLAQIRIHKRELIKLQPLIDRLALNPNDREAALELGKARCFTGDDWDAGLPLLAKGADAYLASLAKSDLSNPATPVARLALADEWWTYALAAKGSDAVGAESRARLHYGMALGGLVGLEKARVQKRLESSASNGKQQSSLKRPKSLIIWFDASAGVRGPGGATVEAKPNQGTPVWSWADVYGGRGIATQGEPKHQPVLKSNIFGKKPGIEFLGGQWLTTDIAASNEGTFALVCKPSSVDTYMRIIGCAEGAPGSRLSTRLKGEVWHEVVKQSHTCDFLEAPAGSLQANQPVILTSTWPSPWMLRANGKGVRKDKPPQYNSGNGGGVVIGAFGENGGDAFLGAIAEFRLYDRILPEDELGMVEAELRGKWLNSSK
jgi:hypothetical protein